MLLYEQEIEIRSPLPRSNPLEWLDRQVAARIGEGATPIRFAVTKSDEVGLRCDVGLLADPDGVLGKEQSSIFRTGHPQAGLGGFNVALVVPTGIGAELGGHAGDAGPVARIFSGLCDRLITHPNVVNASDINELPENGLYVEGSVLSRFLLGTVGLRERRAARVLVVIDDHDDSLFTDCAINSVNAAVAAYGLSCPQIITRRPGVRLRARFAPSGCAAGRVEELAPLIGELRKLRDEYDAVAISSVIDVPHEFHREYFEAGGTMVNPWGGVEAMLTHAVSTILDVPSAHAPMFESQKIANMSVGIVDPRMAAEAVSQTFMQCILKGLSRSPAIVPVGEDGACPNALTVNDVSCLVIPNGCLGLPTLAALEHGYSVIAVRESRNVMKNDLTLLPWRPGQFIEVENYWEAAGVIAALRAGVIPRSVRRPLAPTLVDRAAAATTTPELSRAEPDTSNRQS